MKKKIFVILSSISLLSVETTSATTADELPSSTPHAQVSGIATDPTTVIGLCTKTDDVNLSYPELKVFIHVMVGDDIFSVENTLWAGDISFAARKDCTFISRSFDDACTSMPSTVVFNYVYFQRELEYHLAPPPSVNKIRYKLKPKSFAIIDDEILNRALKLNYIKKLILQRVCLKRFEGYKSIQWIKQRLDSLQQQGRYFPRYRISGRPHLITDSIVRSELIKVACCSVIGGFVGFCCGAIVVGILNGEC